jgi:hypothetical protein
VNVPEILKLSLKHVARQLEELLEFTLQTRAAYELQPVSLL